MECRIDKSLPVGRIACKQGKNFETFLNTEMNDIERCKIGGLPNGSKVLLLTSAKVEGPRLGVEAHLSHSKNQCQRQRETESETKQVPDCGMQNPNLQHKGISKKHRLKYCDLLASSLCFYLSGEESFPNSSLLFSESSTEGFQSYLGSLLLHKSKHVVTWCYL